MRPAPLARRHAALFAAGIACIALAPGAHAQDVREIQRQEALRAQVRVFDGYARFRTALIARFGSDPWLSALRTREGESEALVHADAGAEAVHVIWRDGSWLDAPSHRRLEPWGRRLPAEARRFRLSSVDVALWQRKLAERRAAPAHAADFVREVTVAWFGAPFDTIAIDIGLAGVVFSLESIVFDLEGRMLDVQGAIAKARERREAKRDAR